MGSFTCFALLPSEIRLKIWVEALLVESVWAAVPENDDTDTAVANRRAFRMSFLGSSPSSVGFSCSEAWLLMRKLCQPLRGLGSAGSSRGISWVNLAHTVVTLGPASESRAILDCFDAEETSKFQHVSLLLQSWVDMCRNCRRLSVLCPSLRTIIIQCVRPETPEAVDPQLNIPTAAFYAALSQYEGPEIGYETLDAAFLRAEIQSYFGGLLPRLHVLPPNPTAQLLCS
ncbi:hypothetical protein BX600DRAFT_428619 [Xylariales sp. PMI_506]|nr:hypothetical protein BX600DRAFT_428619 [Xylariales sp. PMI_506]